MRAPNVTDSQHLRCKCEEKLLCAAEKRDATLLSSPGLTGRSSNHRPGDTVGVDGPRRHRCARMRSLEISNKGAVRDEDYPHWYGHVQECFRAARRGCG